MTHQDLNHRFKPGQSVQVTRSRLSTTPAGQYKIVRALPPTGDGLRYRVKSEKEFCERVVDERLMALQDF